MSQSRRPFYAEAYAQALPQVEGIRRRIPSFSSPMLHVQRVGQLDADLLDEELTDLLAEPVKAALQNVSSTASTKHMSEIYLLLRLLLYKFSIMDRGASYGAMLQNLRYRNEWAHTSSLQSTARDAPLRPFQLTLYPILRILLPYAYNKTKAYMSDNRFSDAPGDSPEFLIWSLAEESLKMYNIATLINFAIFLWNGKYRTIVDRILGMRLVYANRSLNRSVSFEFLNRQLVWNAFTEFLLFLLPLIRPQQLLKRLARLPKNPAVLAALYGMLPEGISKRIHLHEDKDGRVRLGHAQAKNRLGPYYNLPEECCALCFQRLERAAGVDVDVRRQPEAIPAPAPSVSIPSVNPMHPSKGLVARRRGREKHADGGQTESSAAAQRAAARAAKVAELRAERRKQAPSQSTLEKPPSLLAASPNGIRYLDALATTPYQTLPCVEKGHECVYCYYCIAEQLLSENMADELADNGGWECLRCGEYVWGARRRDTDAEISMESVKKEL
ncbi:peroxisome assembly protein (Peroxin-2) [Malassezia yamatoensis]|uniref:RING-type E3 ubiquitin transferase (cysteine targeting) n=1 Tax=Malassezia yamatoensis TaxID=253288 RepID=A0AAJ5YPG5_9BASI|nr:peroxisome assembly protein (Peroxin-2) [Malassezia yamatoensis]